MMCPHRPAFPPPYQNNAAAGIDMEESLFWSPNIKQNAVSKEEA